MPKQHSKPQPPKKKQKKQRAPATRVAQIQRADVQLAPVPFSIFGPFETHIRVERNGAISFPSMNSSKIFAQSEAREHASDVGCYVVAKQFGRNAIPLYVGQTTCSFASEVFNPYNRERYRLAVQNYAKGHLVLFLLIPESRNRSELKNAIGELEQYLVGISKKVNPHLQNTYLLPRRCFSLNGIDNATPGQPRMEIQRFKQMMHNEHIV